MSVRIGQASLGETGAHGQKPGNQTGRELNFAHWYSGSWLGVLRFKDRRKAELAAQACEAGVGNKNIGYDQDGRNTAYVAAEAVDFILSKIAKPVETDCSAFMMLCAISAGVDALKETYRKQGNSCTTYCMMRCFPATGEFELLTDRKYLTSDAYLRRGDILVSSGHTVMVLENGEKEDDDMDKATFTELFREMRKDLQDNDCSDWSEAARQWAVNNGIVQGGAPLPDGSANFMWHDDARAARHGSLPLRAEARHDLMAQKKRRRKKLDTSKLVCFLLVGSGLLITQECIYLMRLCIKSNYMASAAWLTAALSLAQVIIITGGKCYFELVKSDHKRGGITFEAAKANGFQEQDASDNVDSAFI